MLPYSNKWRRGWDIIFKLECKVLFAIIQCILLVYKWIFKQWYCLSGVQWCL